MKKISIGSIFLLFTIILISKENEVRPYRLINADTLLVNKITNEYVTDLKGNVHFFYGDTEFFSNKATLYEKKKISILEGNVKVYDDTLSLFSDKATYFRLTEKLILNGNVFVQESHKDSTIRTFNANYIDYFRNTKVIYAKTKVKTYDERENFNGKCGYLVYNMKDGYGYLIKNPILSVNQKDSLTISAEKIEYFKNYKKVVATFNVNTESKDFKIKSNFLLYFSNEQKAIFRGEPFFTSEFADAKANEFQLFIEDQRIHQAILKDSCRVDFKVETNKKKKNWVTAEFMNFLFENGKLRICKAKKNIDSYFKQDKEKKKDFAINEVNGKDLIVKINSENKIESINLKQEVKGKYKFKKK